MRQHASKDSSPPQHTCQKCGQVFTEKRSDNYNKYCSRACSDAVNKNKPAQPHIPKICPHCGNEFLCPPWQSTEHCSVGCSKRHAALTKRGENHPLWKPKPRLTCEVCGTVVEVKPSLVSRFRACSRRCAAILAQQSYPRISSLERAMDEAFNAIGLAVTSQYTIGPYIVDFALPAFRLAVECDGEYWHGKPRQQARDRQKDGFLRSQQWRVVRLTETEIKESASNCALRVAVIVGEA